MNIQTKSLTFQTDSLQDDGTFSGYCSVFDIKDSYDDIVKKGAFTSSLGQWRAKGKMPPMLWQHSRSEVIGVWTKLYEDERGLFGEGRLFVDDIAKAREAYALIKNGAIDGLSIGYHATKWAYNEDEKALELLEIDLKEVSIVTFPANADSTVSSVKAQAMAQHDAHKALLILDNIKI